MQSHELGELAVTTGIWPLYEVKNGVLKLVDVPGVIPFKKQLAEDRPPG